MSTVKITNTEFVRDMNTQAILNTDIAARQQFEQTRKRIKAERVDRTETKERLRQLEQSMHELKTMIAELCALKDTHGNH